MAHFKPPFAFPHHEEFGVPQSILLHGGRENELWAAARTFRGVLLAVAGVSAIVNVLYLTGSLFMLEVYDRVLPSRSVPTLLGLAVLAAMLYAFQGVLELLRNRVLQRVARSFDEAVNARVYDVLVRLPLAGRGGEGLQPIRDLDQIRSFLASGGPSALFDLPWLPFYVVVCFIFHPWIGVMATLGAIVIIGLTLLTELMTRAPAKDAAGYGMRRSVLAEASRSNAEVMHALGMAGRVGARWSAANERFLASQQQLGDIAGGFGAASKVLRMMLQSAVLAVGAYLVIHQQATAGVIIAGSILSARALAPVEQVIGNWKGFIGARQGWRRLSELLQALPARPERMQLPRPTSTLSVEMLAVAPPGAGRLCVADVNFTLHAGQGLGVIGPSAAGKSSLARALVGVWRPARGKVRLDGAPLDHWPPEQLGQDIGYLPQNVELFAGSVAENISRFHDDADPQEIIAAARAADVHDMILRLSDGYETQIGDGGTSLSVGQRQRIGLARALFGEPFLVVLDEPNSNLDSEGEEALTQAMLDVRARGGIVVVVAHRPSALAGVDMILMMAEGRQQAFGPKEAVLPKVLRPIAARTA